MPLHASVSAFTPRPVTRRASPRLDVDGAIPIRFADTNVPVTLKDISLGGFAILTGQPVSVGRTTQFFLGRLEGDGPTVSARAAHCRPVAPGVYLSGWVADDEQSAQLISDVFETFTNDSLTPVA